MRRREHGIGQIARVRHMVHTEIQPEDQILLLQALAVKVLVEVDGRIIHVLRVIRVGDPLLVIMLPGDLHVVPSPIGRVDEIRRVLHRQVRRAHGRQDAVPAGHAVLVLLVLVDDDEFRLAIGAPIEAGLVFGGNVAALELHRVALAAGGPRELAAHGDLVHEQERVVGAEDVEVGLVVQDVVVHGAGQGVLDLPPEIGVVVGVVGRLDVARGAYFHADGPVLAEGVAEGVVVVAHGGDGAHREVDVLAHADVAAGAVALHGEVGVVFEEADAVQVGVGGFVDVEGAVEVGGVGGAVVALYELEGIGTEAVVGVKVTRGRLEGVVGGVVSKGFLQAQLIEDTLTLVLDYDTLGNGRRYQTMELTVVESDAEISGEANVERVVHPLDILPLHVDTVSWTRRCYHDWRRLVIVLEDRTLLVRPRPVTFNVGW